MYEKGKSTDRGAFRLTVPTGGGKTVSSLMFALEHAVKNGMDRIIYVAPFTTIIEQNAQVIRELAGDQNVLEHHASLTLAHRRNLEICNWRPKIGIYQLLLQQMCVSLNRFMDQNLPSAEDFIMYPIV